jgi:hypothetical protein
MHAQLQLVIISRVLSVMVFGIVLVTCIQRRFIEGHRRKYIYII